ncbi:M20/M25/M40 family metallo-hydrolase [Gimibacter soli]|uniref:M20/M25/M40 family metallo-hydrolase n=1 Tax=Gimibacter soli TaxID=3024400 RepID=A0AAE9XQ96_9PROT|nr:M20/M25/M40 family metallo-hydrolase [Gimibacter soli]WCL52945.1 M20/M25/M40 family metallo-hydrolase [Gimibacter soli]
MKKLVPFAAAVLALAPFAYADDASDAARTYRQANEARIIGDFVSLLSMPNVATNKADMDVNAEWITAYLTSRGFMSETVSAGGAPYIIAERKVPGATKTLLIYAHFDGQPVQEEEWASPPFTPTLRDGMVVNGAKVLDMQEALAGTINPEWRLYARSAGDDKAPIIAVAAALDALDKAGIAPSANIKLLLDGEEEQGNPTLEAVLAAHKGKLDADILLFCDGPMHQSRQRQLVFGVRGTTEVQITTYGAERPLHSGHYGSWAPSPISDLSRLVASMSKEDGTLTVKGIDKGLRPVTKAEKAAIAAMPNIDDKLKADLALGRTLGNGQRVEESVMKPALIVTGFNAGGTGDRASNTVVPRATAAINFRLAPGQTPESVREAIDSHIQAQGFFLTEEEPTADVRRAHAKVAKVQWGSGYPAFRTDLDSPATRKLIGLLDGIDGEATLLTPTMGGSLPIHIFSTAMPTMPIVILPVANHDNNQHGENENMRIQNLWDAIEIYATVIAGYGK